MATAVNKAVFSHGRPWNWNATAQLLAMARELERHAAEDRKFLDAVRRKQ